MIDYKFKKSATYLVSCNFSPDSMALVDMLLQSEVKPVIVYIDYGREGGEEDIEGLRNYCWENGLRLEVRIAPQPPEDVEDYSAWSRDIRYGFFKEIYEIYNASALFLAHSQDDLLENYMYQRDHKKSLYKHGINRVCLIHGMMVVRPLLHLTRQDLIEYAEEHRVPFSKRAADFELYHTKSEYYREIASMSEIDRDNLIREMEYRNDESIKMNDELKEQIDEGEELDIRALIALSPDAFAATVERFLSKGKDEIKITEALLAKIRAFCLSPIPNDAMQLAGETYLMKQYDTILVGHRFDTLPYTYVLQKPTVLNTPNFYLDFTGGAEDRGIHEEDYPLTIRSALPYDTFVVHNFLENVHTLYSIWKMPMRLRYIWPIFVNKNGKIVYVPRYRKNFSEEHTSILRMKLKDEER